MLIFGLVDVPLWLILTLAIVITLYISSRLVIWLELAPTNRQPEQTCSYFIEAVGNYSVPHNLRVDAATENDSITLAQTSLCADFDRLSGLPTSLEGSSNHNERIERFWSLLRLQEINFWMNHFKGMMSNGLLVAWDNFDRLGTRNFDYFKKRGIPGPKPWPFIGTFYKFFSPGVYDMHQEAKQKYGKIIGNFMGNTPSYVIFDEEMLSQITVKQFQNFTDRRSQKMGNEAFDCMLTLLKGDHWRHVRSQMSPAFTTGKLRMMSNEINRSSRTLAKCLIAKKEPFEARALASRYTMDVIASTGFGLRVNSQEDEDNAFLKNAKKIMNFSLRNPKVVILFICPWLIPYLNKLGFSIFNDDATDFFVNVVDQSLAGRAEGNEKRGDFLQLMVKASQGQDIRDVDEEKETEDKEKVVSRNTGMTKNEILGNALIFFLAGYDTTSAALSYLMYLLSCNQDCQQKLIEEIDSVVGDKDDIDYDTAMKMPYLDQCLQESLRIYPPGIIVDRTAVVDTEVCGIKIEKGMTVVIPIMAIHRDPEIWPEPMKFDPERFTPENKANMNPFHWMPFGYGPRNCIAMRLALYEIKIAIATILRTHKIVTCEKTQIPLKLSKSKLAHSEKGIWLSVEKRTEE